MVKKDYYYSYNYSSIFIIFFIIIACFLSRYFTQFEKIIKIKKLDIIEPSSEFSRRSKKIIIIDTDNNIYKISLKIYPNPKQLSNLEVNKTYMIKGYLKKIYDIKEVLQ